MHRPLILSLSLLSLAFSSPAFAESECSQPDETQVQGSKGVPVGGEADLHGFQLSEDVQLRSEMTWAEARSVQVVDHIQLDGQRMEVELEFDDKNIALELEPNRTLFASLKTIRRYRAGGQYEELSSWPANLPIPYKGFIQGETNSWVRVSLNEGEPHGLLFSEGKLYELRNHGDGLSIAPAALAYSETFADSLEQVPRCGLTQEMDLPLAPTNPDYESAAAAAAADVHSGERQKTMLDECMLLPISMAGDHTFVGSKGGNEGAEARIMSNMNEVDAVYRSAINLGFRIVSLDTYGDAGSPGFNPGGDPGIVNLLMAIKDYKADASNMPEHTAGLLHVMTARYRAGTVGLAYQGVTCTTNGGISSSISSDTNDLAWLVAAHEIGHNFHCPHDGTESLGADCRGTGGGYIMQPTASPSATSFSDCSKRVMNEHITSIMEGRPYYMGTPNCYDPCVGCGNGIVEDGEDCDDGNDIDDDACPNDCMDKAPPEPMDTGMGEEGDSNSGSAGEDGGPDAEGGDDSGMDDSAGGNDEGGTSEGGGGGDDTGMSSGADGGGQGGGDGGGNGGGGTGVPMDTGMDSFGTESGDTFGGDDSDDSKSCQVTTGSNPSNGLLFGVPFMLFAWMRRRQH